MILEYPTEYTDRRGTENSKFITDGQTLKITLRGIEFEGHFWELSPIEGQVEEAKKLFDLNEWGEISGGYYDPKSPTYFTLKVEMPIKVVTLDNKEIDAKIEFWNNEFKLNFIINEKTLEFEKPSFEYGLSIENTKTLKINYVKCCINCKYSGFSPYGNREYGDLICFKNCKEAWEEIGYTGLKVEKNWEKVKDRITTQEAYWCEEFKLKD